MATTFEVLEGVLRVNTAGWRTGFRVAEQTARGFVRTVTKGFDMATAAAGRTVKAVRKVGTDLVSAGAQITAAGVGIGAAASKITASFEQSMARVSALTGDKKGSAAFVAMEAAAKQMGETTEFSARQAADAMQFFGLAGFKANEIIGALPDTLKLASAGKLEIGQAADIAAKVMKGMGLEVKDLGNVTDVLTKAFTTSNTDLVQLGEAFKKVGPVAKAAGINLTDTAAAVQKLSDAGIQGEAAGSALRNIYAKLAGNAKSVKDVMGPLGISVRNVDGSMRPLPDVIDDFNNALKAQGREGERAGLLMEAFGLRAGPAMAVLLETGGTALRQAAKDLHDPGVAARISAQQLDTLQGSVTILKSGVEGLAIAIGQKINPAIRDNVDAATKWLRANRGILAGGFVKFWETLGFVIDETVQSIRRLWQISEPARLALAGLKGEAAGLYAQFMALFNTMPEWLRDMIKVTAAFSAAALAVNQLSMMIPILGTVLRALFVTLGPIGWALLIIGTIAGVVMRNWDAIVLYIRENFGPALDWMMEKWIWISSWFQVIFPAVMNMALGFLSQFRDGAVSIVGGLFARIASIWAAIKPIIVKVVQEVRKTVVVAIMAAVQFVAGVIAAFRKFYADNAATFARIGRFVRTVFIGLVRVLGTLYVWLQRGYQIIIPLVVKAYLWWINTVMKTITFLIQLVETIWDKIKPALDMLIRIVGKVLVGVFKVAIAIIKGAIDILKSLWQILKPILQLVWELATAIGQVLYDAFVAIAEPIWEVIKAIGRLIFGTGKLIEAEQEQSKATEYLTKVIENMALMIRGLLFVVEWIVKPLVFLARVLTNVVAVALRTVIAVVKALVIGFWNLITLDFKGFKRTQKQLGEELYQIWSGAANKIGDAWEDMVGKQTKDSKGQVKVEQKVGKVISGELVKIRQQQQIKAAQMRANFNRRQTGMEVTDASNRGRAAGAAEANAFAKERARLMAKFNADNRAALQREMAANGAAAGAAGAAGGGRPAARPGVPGGGVPGGGIPGAGGVGGIGGNEPKLPEAPAAVESFRQISQAIAASGEEMRTAFSDQVQRMFGVLSKGANLSAAKMNRFFAMLSQEAKRHSKFLIDALNKHLAESGKRLTGEQKKQIINNRNQLAGILQRMKRATGDQKKALAARAIEIERDMRLMFVRIKIAGTKAWEDMTDAQRGELAKQKANLDKEAAQMIAALGEFNRKLAENAVGRVRRAGGGGGAVAGVQQAIGNLTNRIFGGIDQNVRDAVQGMARFNSILRATVDPAERTRLLLGKARGELQMFVHNAKLLEDGMNRTWKPIAQMEALERQRLLIGEKRLQVQRMEAELARIAEEREARRLAAFRAYQESLQQSERRREEDRELFGAQTTQFTGGNRPIDIGQRPEIGAAVDNRRQVTENRSTVIYNTFEEELTPDRVRQLADALEAEYGNRGTDLSGQSSLRGV